MEWRRFGYSAEQRTVTFQEWADDGIQETVYKERWFYTVHTYSAMDIGTIELDEDEQGPFVFEQEAMAHLEAWIDEQYKEEKVEEMRRLRV